MRKLASRRIYRTTAEQHVEIFGQMKKTPPPVKQQHGEDFNHAQMRHCNINPEQVYVNVNVSAGLLSSESSGGLLIGGPVVHDDDDCMNKSSAPASLRLCGILSDHHSYQDLRVLRLGSRKQIALMRPVVPVSPEWRDISRRVKQEAAPSFLQRFQICQSINACSIDNNNNADILNCNEHEISSADKIFLLVSRAMNDKTCLVGKIYKSMMCEFYARMGRLRYREQKPRARRLDCHSILNELMQILRIQSYECCSSRLDMNMRSYSIAMALQSLVFGELYEHVFEEILMEWGDKDGDLRQKSVSLLHDGCYGEEESSESCSRSNGAIEALRQLPETVTPTGKVEHCIQFLERLCEFITMTTRGIKCRSFVASINIDPGFLFDAICRHILLAVGEGNLNLNAEVSFLTEFANDEYLLGKGGFAVVILQSALHYLDACSNITA